MEFHITVSNLIKKIDNKKIIEGISFFAFKGKTLGIVGPRKSGKTVLAYMLAGIEDPTEGEIKFFDTTYKENRIEINRRMGFVPERDCFYPHWTVGENMEFFGSLYDVDIKKIMEREDSLVDALELGERLNDNAGILAPGMKKRLSLILSVMHDPWVLILDDPLRGLDGNSKRFIIDFLKKINKERKTTIIYIGGFHEELEDFLAQVMIINHGKMHGLDTVAKLVEEVQGGIIRLVLGGSSPQLVDRMREIPGVVGITFERESMIIKSRDPVNTLSVLYANLNALNVEINELKVYKPSFHTAYLNTIEDLSERM